MGTYAFLLSIHSIHSLQICLQLLPDKLTPTCRLTRPYFFVILISLNLFALETYFYLSNVINTLWRVWVSGTTRQISRQISMVLIATSVIFGPILGMQRFYFTRERGMKLSGFHKSIQFCMSQSKTHRRTVDRCPAPPNSDCSVKFGQVDAEIYFNRRIRILFHPPTRYNWLIIE